MVEDDGCLLHDLPKDAGQLIEKGGERISPVDLKQNREGDGDSGYVASRDMELCKSLRKAPAGLPHSKSLEYSHTTAV